MLGRAKLYSIGFAVFTVASIALSLLPGKGDEAAIYLIGARVVQGIGGAMIMANATALLTDAFPVHQRGFAIGINSIAAIAGQFLGLLIGGLLADWNWQFVFWINVPIGLIGTIWAFWKLTEAPTKGTARIDWAGNIVFAVALVLLLTGITYGIQPHGTDLMGWTSPLVLTLLSTGVVGLILFVVVEQRVKQPMLDLKLFRLKPFSYGNAASLAAAVARGGLQLMLIMWLQGIWLPLHGYSFESTPLWSAIFMLPLTVGFLVAGPLSGYLSDRFGPRPFATGGMAVGAASFLAMTLLPADFNYWLFSFLLLLNGLGTGLFSAPNSIQIMNAVPARERGQASGTRATTMNAGGLLSIGIFFSLMIAGLASSLSQTMQASLVAQGLDVAVATKVASAPPVASLFAAFLGYNPMRELIPPEALQTLSADKVALITGKEFFPSLISGPFMDGIKLAFTFAGVLNLLAALASALSGSKYVFVEETSSEVGAAAE
jgi:MFS family permease